MNRSRMSVIFSSAFLVAPRHVLVPYVIHIYMLDEREREREIVIQGCRE